MFKRLALAATALAIMCTSTLAGPKCTCRFQGHNYKIGDMACILGKLKRCEMQLNNTSWQTITDGCPQVRAPTATPAQMSFAPKAKS